MEDKKYVVFECAALKLETKAKRNFLEGSDGKKFFDNVIKILSEAHDYEINEMKKDLNVSKLANESLKNRNNNLENTKKELLNVIKQVMERVEEGYMPDYDWYELADSVMLKYKN